MPRLLSLIFLISLSWTTHPSRSRYLSYTAVDTTPVLCKTALSEMALLEKNSSGVGEGSVEGGAGRFGMSRGAGVHPSRWSQLLCVHEICVES